MSRNPNYGYPPDGDYRLPEREHALRHPSDDETPDDPPPRPKLFENRINLGHLLTIGVTVVAVTGSMLVTWGEFKAQGREIERRISNMEAKEQEIRRSYETVREKLLHIDGKVDVTVERGAAQQRQLDRIERAVDAIAMRRPSTP